MKFERIPREDTATPEDGQDSLPDLLRFWRRSVAKHKLMIVLLTALTGAIAGLIAFSLTPIYRATATLFIEPTKTKVVSIEEVYSGISATRDHIQTQAEIMKSRALIAKLVKRLDLAAHPAFDLRQRSLATNSGINWRDYVPAAWVASGQAMSDEEAQSATIRAVTSALEVSLVRNSQLIRISFESPDRVLAASAANGLADLYIENDLEARVQMTQKVASWLTGRLKSLRETLEASERTLQEFRDREQIVDAKGVALGASRQLEEMSSSIVAARQKVAELENSYNQVQAVLKGKSRVTLDSIPAVLRNPTVIKVKELENEAGRRLVELGKRYGAEHPRMIAAEADLQTARQNTNKAVDTVVASITREYEVAKATEQTLTAALNKSKMGILDINRKEFELAALEREVQTNRQLYDMFFSRFKETSAAGDMQSNIARVIDPAIVPAAPVRPLKTHIILTSVFLGLILSVMLAFLLEHLDNTVRTSSDVESKLEAPLLGLLPWVRDGRGKSELQRAFLEDTDHVFAEAVRTLRTGVLMSSLDSPHRTILVTSSMPEEGKTSVAMNLALSLAQLKRTCLVDADMRRPQLARILGFDPAAPGLSQLVAGSEPKERCIQCHQDSGLHFIPSGPVPANPLEILSSRRFDEILKGIAESFDVVVFDSPPVQLVSDAVVLAGIAEAVVFVVRADSTPYQVAKGGIEILTNGRAQLLGVVLNQVDLDKTERYYGYGEHYSHGGKYRSYRAHTRRNDGA